MLPSGTRAAARRRVMRRSAALAALTALVACSDPVPLGLAPCTGPVSIQVSGGLQPAFSWTPECTVASLWVWVVLPPSAGGDQPTWIASTTIQYQGLQSPVRYGAAAPGVRTYGEPALVAGRDYYVTLHADTGQIAKQNFSR